MSLLTEKQKAQFDDINEYIEENWKTAQTGPTQSITGKALELLCIIEELDKAAEEVRADKENWKTAHTLLQAELDEIRNTPATNPANNPANPRDKFRIPTKAVELFKGMECIETRERVHGKEESGKQKCYVYELHRIHKDSGDTMGWLVSLKKGKRLSDWYFHDNITDATENYLNQ